MSTNESNDCNTDIAVCTGTTVEQTTVDACNTKIESSQLHIVNQKIIDSECVAACVTDCDAEEAEDNEDKE